MKITEPKAIPIPFDEKLWSIIEEQLPFRLKSFRWFGGKSREIRTVQVVDRIPIGDFSALAVIEVAYVVGESERYLLPLAWLEGVRAKRWLQGRPQALIAENQGLSAALYAVDAIHLKDFRNSLFKKFSRHPTPQKWSGPDCPCLEDAQVHGQIQGIATHYWKKIFQKNQKNLRSDPLRTEQSNTSIKYGNSSILKIYRRIEEGANPDVEISRYLSEENHFRSTPYCLGTLEYHKKNRIPFTVGMMSAYVKNNQDAWSYFQAQLSRLLRLRKIKAVNNIGIEQPPYDFWGGIQKKFPLAVTKGFSPFLSHAEKLGQQTFQMHRLLALGTHSKFIPEPLTPNFQLSLYDSLVRQSQNTLESLRKVRTQLPPAHMDLVDRLLRLQDRVNDHYRILCDEKIESILIRVHGDYHLGQVLFNGKEFFIIDFEGEPARSFSERKFKHSPLRDVAGMLRSFHYAANVALQPFAQTPAVENMQRILHSWHQWVRFAFLKGYFLDVVKPKKSVSSIDFLPRSQFQILKLLDLFMLEKAFYELHYEMNNRPDWVQVPLRGILDILEEKQ